MRVYAYVEKSINDRKRLAQLFLAWGSLRYGAQPAVAFVIT